MSDERCAATHPTLNIQCERRKKDCWGLGVDHLVTLEDGPSEFWPNLEGSTPMHEYFRFWITSKKALAEKREDEE